MYTVTCKCYEGHSLVREIGTNQINLIHMISDIDLIIRLSSGLLNMCCVAYLKVKLKPNMTEHTYIFKNLT